MTNFELIKQHEEDTKYCSLYGHMQSVSTTYKEIIAKGEDILPDILKYLFYFGGGMSIIMLLERITGHSPYEPKPMNGTELVAYYVSDAIKAWISWGKENNYI